MNTHVIEYLENKMKKLTTDCIQNKVSWKKFEIKMMDIAIETENEKRVAKGLKPCVCYDFEPLFSQVGG